MEANHTLAIIIANYNGDQDTRACLESLQQATYKDFFVVLVDDCSTETRLEALAEMGSFDYPVKYLRTEKNMGFAGANNVGIREALSKNPKYVLLLNNDTVVDPEALTHLLMHIEGRTKTILAPKILKFYDKDILWAAGMKVDKKRMLCQNAYFDEVDTLTKGELLSVEAVSFCAALFPREAFAEIGLLSEEYYMYHEDVDYCFRAARKGYQFLCATGAVIWHKDGATGIGASKKGYYLATRNECYIREKYFAQGKKYNDSLKKDAGRKLFLKSLLRKNTEHQKALLAALAAWEAGEQGKCFDHFQRVDIYVCTTSYHLLISLIKALKSGHPSKLILNTKDTLPEVVVERIRQSGIFEEVYFKPYLDQKNQELVYPANKLMWKKSLRSQLDQMLSWWEHKENYTYYLYNDVSIIGKWLNSHKMEYHLLEDGCDTYKLESILSLNYQEPRIKRWIKKRLGIGFYSFGLSDYSKTIEVNSLDGILIKSRNVIEKPKKELFQSLTKAEGQRILSIYLEEAQKQQLQKKLSQFPSGEVSLLLTQPWADDHELSKESHRSLYEDIVKEYAKYSLVIKPHPRDRVDYTEIFPKALILDCPYLPVELLDLLGELSVQQAITLSSTSIHSLSFVEEKVVLGMEYMKPYILGDEGFEPFSQYIKDLVKDCK